MKKSRRARVWTIAGATLLTVAMVLGFSIFRGDSGEDPPATIVPPPPVERIEVGDAASLTVPETVRTAAESFHTADGQSYLLRFEVSTTKPERGPGAAMYLGVSLNCAGGGGNHAESAGGTQNLITGEPATLRNQFVLVGDGGMRSCNISLSAPSPDVAAAGATVEFDVRWTAEPIDESSFEVDSAERLPMSVQADARAVVFSRTFDPNDVRGSTLNVLSTLHLTACTGVNGSREDGRAWCDVATVDTDGTEVGLLLQVDLLDAGGQPCREIETQLGEVRIDRFTHHRLVDVSLEAAVPDRPCGPTVRVSLTLDVQGPAPVVVHGSASSFVVAVREDMTGAEDETEW